MRWTAEGVLQIARRRIGEHTHLRCPCAASGHLLTQGSGHTVSHSLSRASHVPPAPRGFFVRPSSPPNALLSTSPESPCPQPLLFGAAHVPQKQAYPQDLIISRCVNVLPSIDISLSDMPMPNETYSDITHNALTKVSQDSP